MVTLKHLLATTMQSTSAPHDLRAGLNAIAAEGGGKVDRGLTEEMVMSGRLPASELYAMTCMGDSVRAAQRLHQRAMRAHQVFCS